jgi:hypothetical protein
MMRGLHGDFALLAENTGNRREMIRPASRPKKAPDFAGEK